MAHYGSQYKDGDNGGDQIQLVEQFVFDDETVNVEMGLSAVDARSSYDELSTMSDHQSPQRKRKLCCGLARG